MQKFSSFIRKYWFALLVIGFVVFILFFSEHSALQLYRYRHQERYLKREIESFKDSIAEYERLIEEVSGESEDLEHFARKKLGMKRENEDVYLID